MQALTPTPSEHPDSAATTPTKRKAAVKRETSASPDSESGSPSPAAKKKAKLKSSPGKPPSPWNADNCAKLLEMIFAHSSRTADLAAIAAELGVSKSQVVDQLKPNRSDVRLWAVQGIRAKKGGA